MLRSRNALEAFRRSAASLRASVGAAPHREAHRSLHSSTIRYAQSKDHSREKIPSLFQVVSSALSSTQGQVFVVGVFGLAGVALAGQKLFSDSDSHGHHPPAPSPSSDHHEQSAADPHGDSEQVKADEPSNEAVNSTEPVAVYPEPDSVDPEPSPVNDTREVTSQVETEQGKVEQQEAAASAEERTTMVEALLTDVVAKAEGAHDSAQSDAVSAEPVVENQALESLIDTVAHALEGGNYSSAEVAIAVASSILLVEATSGEAAETSSQEPSPVESTDAATAAPKDSEQEEEEECGFCKFMKAGPCGSSFVAWEKCVEEAEKSGENLVEKCVGVTHELKVCMDGNPEYYSIVLDAEKAMVEQADKVEGEKAVVEGEKAVVEGEKAVVEGEKEVVQGEEGNSGEKAEEGSPAPEEPQHVEEVEAGKGEKVVEQQESTTTVVVPAAEAPIENGAVPTTSHNVPAVAAEN